MIRLYLPRLSTLIVAVCVSSCLSAFGRAKELDLFTVEKSNFVDTIPIEYRKGQILVPVSIDGKKFRFCLDTGTNCFVFNADRDIPHRPAGIKEVVSDVSNLSKEHDLARVDSLYMGNILIKNITGLLSQQPIFSCYNDGLIGFNLIDKGYTIKIDLQNNLLIVTDKRKFFNHEKGICFKYITKSGQPYFKTNISGGGMVYSLFDTGRPTLFEMNKKEVYDFFAKRNNSKGDSDFLSQVVWSGYGVSKIGANGVTPAEEHVFMNLRNLSIGKLTLSNVNIEVKNGFCAYGSKILEYGSLIINPYNHTFTFQPYNKSDRISIDGKTTNLLFVVENNKTVVGLVNPQSEAYTKGARVGDELIEMDSMSISDFCTFSDMVWKNKNNPYYSLKLLDKSGHIKEMTIKR